MEAAKGKRAHVLAVPFPAQRHVKPLMKLCRQIAKHGIKVTFVNTDRIHDRIAAAAAASTRMCEEQEENEEDNLVLVSVPDGLGPEDDPNNTFKMVETLRKSMPQSLTGLIRRINGSNPDEKITCVIADVTVEWVLESVRELGVGAVLFSPASAATLVLLVHVPKLLKDGILDDNGSIKKGEKITVSDGIPAWGKDDLNWSFPTNLQIQKIFFQCGKRIQTTANQCDLFLFNTFYELESSACDLGPNFLPIGPLLEATTPKSRPTSYSFHPEDASSLTWLDSKPPRSVIYVSFGSLAFFSQQQFDELAFGLELSGRAFLWVVRMDLANGSRAVYPDGFLDRVGGLGKVVEWAPQEEVLSHPSVACFLSHCGWNSTLEGLSAGVLFLCWPFFGDQFHNQNYICDKWEIGLRINYDGNGFRSRDEIREKIDMVYCDYDKLKANALKLRDLSAKSVKEGGSSCNNFGRFIDYLIKKE